MESNINDVTKDGSLEEFLGELPVAEKISAVIAATIVLLYLINSVVLATSQARMYGTWKSDEISLDDSILIIRLDIDKDTIIAHYIYDGEEYDSLREEYKYKAVSKGKYEANGKYCTNHKFEVSFFDDDNIMLFENDFIFSQEGVYYKY